jgi:hypothetical protein
LPTGEEEGMTFVALATLKIKKNGTQQEIPPGQIFTVSDQNEAIIAKLIKEGKGRALKDFCQKCDLFEQDELDCSWEKDLSFNHVCVGPYEYKEGRLILSVIC